MTIWIFQGTEPKITDICFAVNLIMNAVVESMKKTEAVIMK